MPHPADIFAHSSLDTWPSVTLLVVNWSIRVLLGLRIIMRRTPVATSLAWLLIVLFVPILGLVLYLLVGENRLGARGARRAADLRADIESKALALWKAAHDDWTARGASYSMLAKLGTAVSGLPPLRGNELELIGDAHAVLDRLVADIDASRDHCHLTYYIWMPKDRGVAVAEALIRAAERGVTCRVLVDAVGAGAFLRSDLPGRLRGAGVRVSEAMPVSFWRFLLARIDLRNHRKMAVIDGRVGYCGSQNLTDETYLPQRRKKKRRPWLDATVRMRGPAVTALQTVFLSDWLQDGGEPLEAFDRFLVASAPAGESVAHVIPSGPGTHTAAVHHAFLTLLHSARERIVMSTPYFIPDEATASALLNAALRGVDVSVILPERLDAPLVAAAGRAHYEDMLEAGVKIFEHREHLLHAKTVTVDGRVAVVTSANFDVRSFYLNFETSVFAYDEPFARELLRLQQRYIAESEELFLRDWRRRPWLKRLGDKAARLFGPLM